MFESLSIPGKFNIWVRERYSVICNIYYCLSKTKCHNNVASNTGGLCKCLPRTQERAVVLREATGIVLTLASIFQKFPPLLLLTLEKNKKVVSWKLKHFVWLKKISFTSVWMFSLINTFCIAIFQLIFKINYLRENKKNHLPSIKIFQPSSIKIISQIQHNFLQGFSHSQKSIFQQKPFDKHS